METILDKEKMGAMKALADTNMEISKSKALLIELQENETSYLEEREKKAMDIVGKILEESRAVIEEAKENYHGVHQFNQTVSSFSNTLNQAHEMFQNLVQEFDVKNQEWEKDIKSQLDEIGDLRKQIKEDKIRIENDQNAVERTKKLNKDEMSVIESRQAQIRVALEVLETKK